MELDIKRLAFVDSLRGWAILSVVLTHSAAIVESDAAGMDQLRSLLGTGRFGVELFFMISGFLIGWLYIAPRKSSRRAYLLSRFRRIWPLWASFSAIALFGHLVRGPGAEASPVREFFLNIVFLGWTTDDYGNSFLGGQWSIQIEVACYLLAAILLRKSIWVFIATATGLNSLGILIGALNRTGSNLDVVDALSRLSVWSGFSFFTVGVVIASTFSQAKTDSHSRLEVFRERPLLLLSFLATTAVAPAYAGNIFEILGYVILSGSAVLLLHQGRKLRKLLQTFGKYSYFIFFLHFFILELIQSTAFMNTNLGLLWAVVAIGGVFITTSIGSLCLAVPSWKYFEYPITRIGRR
mgnify:CR=1 FL=1